MKTQHTAQCPHCQCNMMANGDSCKAMLAMPYWTKFQLVNHCWSVHQVKRRFMRKWFEDRQKAGLTRI